jgi:hypothetical protein
MVSSATPTNRKPSLCASRWLAADEMARFEVRIADRLALMAHINSHQRRLVPTLLGPAINEKAAPDEPGPLELSDLELAHNHARPMVATMLVPSVVVAAVPVGLMRFLLLDDNHFAGIRG